MGDATRIFYSALELDTADQSGYLRTACRNRPDLRRRVERLLDPDASLLEFQAPVMPSFGDVTGHQLDHFYIHKLIAQGGSADVYLATDTRPPVPAGETPAEWQRFRYTRREVAVKILRTIGAPDDFPNEQFSIDDVTSNLPAVEYGHEADSAADIREVLPDFPDYLAWSTVVYSGIYQRRPYFVLPYYPLTLADRMHHFDPGKLAAYLGAQLDHLHASGMLHRDIKPKNLFLLPLTEERVQHHQKEVYDNPFFLCSEMDRSVYRLIIGDYSLLHRMEEPLIVSPYAGTLTYSAPEIIIGDAASPATDQYALAATVYYHHTGRPPFRADTTDELMRSILMSALDPDTVIPEATGVFQRAMAKLPADRYDSCLAFAESLGEAFPFTQHRI